MQTLSIFASDRQPLKACQFSPKGWLKGSVIIAPAMGTTQFYYQPIAQWLAEQGYAVTTFDYRGIGESKTQDVRLEKADILDWAELDCSAILKHVLQEKQDMPVYWLGHSLGGQIFPLVDKIEQVDKVITFAAGTGYWRLNSPQLRKKIWWFWQLFVPLTLAIYGYFPGKKLGKIGDLPKAVMAQWRRWCLDPEYCVGVESNEVKNKFALIKVPIVSISFTDDEMLSPQNIEALFSMFGSDSKQLKQVEPDAMGVKRIGHLGFFRQEFEANLWGQLLLPELNQAYFP